MTARDVIAQLIFDELTAQCTDNPFNLIAGRLEYACLDGDFRLLKVADRILSAPDSVRLELAAMLNPWRPIETKLWLWKNGDHYLAFDNAYPCHPGGDPMTLGEPIAVAMFRRSLPAPPSEDKA